MKKEYTKPQMEVMNVRTGLQLLAGSIQSPIDGSASEPAHGRELDDIFEDVRWEFSE